MTDRQIEVLEEIYEKLTDMANFLHPNIPFRGPLGDELAHIIEEQKEINYAMFKERK